MKEQPRGGRARRIEQGAPGLDRAAVVPSAKGRPAEPLWAQGGGASGRERVEQHQGLAVQVGALERSHALLRELAVGGQREVIGRLAGVAEPLEGELVPAAADIGGPRGAPHIQAGLYALGHVDRRFSEGEARFASDGGVEERDELGAPRFIGAVPREGARAQQANAEAGVAGQREPREQVDDLGWGGACGGGEGVGAHEAAVVREHARSEGGDVEHRQGLGRAVEADEAAPRDDALLGRVGGGDRVEHGLAVAEGDGVGHVAGQRVR